MSQSYLYGGFRMDETGPNPELRCAWAGYLDEAAGQRFVEAGSTSKPSYQAVALEGRAVLEFNAFFTTHASELAKLAASNEGQPFLALGVPVFPPEETDEKREIPVNGKWIIAKDALDARQQLQELMGSAWLIIDVWDQRKIESHLPR